MEMHQVRYFLAAAVELNFTKAAEKCNVTQPSLTRAIKQLEGELGGDLFRRERPQTQLTELGERMVPLLKQCYESALGARSLASSFKSGEVGSLRLALSQTVYLEPLLAHLNELRSHFARLELKLLRGTAAEVVGFLKSGDAELAIAAELGEEWERLDRWPLFGEGFDLLVNGQNEIAARNSVEIEDLRPLTFLRRSHCEHAGPVVTLLRDRHIDIDHGHEVNSEGDLIALIEANAGVAVAPRGLRIPPSLGRLTVSGIDLRRTVYVYGVAGRQRTTVGSALLKMLRGADWTRYGS